ncbi:MAG: hypothetical protein A3B30_04230 [Candidatus Komeilibacteria bacterium RIFCSPLOWO2_01_FULL_52_15]|uniref:Gcp-like domain-containing protein n=1 Tax=Candidatus Komeilibacteria bacterium RIFCSPLOWO2_01_FULL_52_15 TaxID=1798551 RepID=A0A1G2BPP9_9BACT|nr:MAG: hypothetical protein A3B30_04230 [Candidatus Komeilibacteria bacterium RIFCSPLOWO2_01_FULL_52_15]
MFDAYLIVFGMDEGKLHLGILKRRSLRRDAIDQRRISENLLTAVNALLGTSRLRAIAVQSDRLGGFASTRIILTTLNTLAWYLDIPLIALPQTGTAQRASSVSTLLKLFSSSGEFKRFIIPHYSGPANITRSKKRKRFTIG